MFTTPSPKNPGNSETSSGLRQTFVLRRRSFDYFVDKDSSYINMETISGGNPREYSSVFHWFVHYIFCTLYNKISGCSLEIRVDHVDKFHQIICNRISYPSNQLELEIDPTLAENEVLGIDFGDFRCWGLIDVTDFRTTRTGSGPQPDGSRRAFSFELQCDFYSRYFRAQGIKYLSIYFVTKRIDWSGFWGLVVYE